ncbi:ribosomal protection-like ABC-F family protein [Tissierella sp. Yu-01]|uniref:ribosomal protection-like ABC-F family protein n=1 Tax=Tissierella sp. Yu-01 TaxID=3035694 RepID=UPI00240E6387|nr:ABC-F type ribosomal protection protein [Tissierella sp. Yu-01]WFA08427.1 ABC-F type ribosomal protection protein [Tissierella sp. Yu-01]
MIECSVNNLVKYYGAIKVFENISFDIQTNERVGLIGQNGCGKSTLMKILMGIEDYHGGTISFRKGVKVGYLDQIFKCPPETTVMDILQSSFEDVKTLGLKIKVLEEKLKTLSGDTLENEMKTYGELIEEYERMGGYDIETNINKICSGLMIPDSFRNKHFEFLSGGEKTRVQLAKLLLEEPDLLLLDEPTNHLDIKSIEWLEEFLLNYKGTVFMVSHDRQFLDKVANRIIELEPSVANLYDGNYSAYVVEKEKRFEIAYRAYVNNQRKIEQMERQIERYRIWGAMRDSEKMYKRAKELEKRLDKIEVLDRPSIDTSKMRLNADGINRSGKIVMDIEGLSKSFEQKKLFRDLSFTLFFKDRLCIMGENGSGKTTLLKVILDETNSDKGEIKIGSNVTIGYLPQNVTFEDERLSILDHFSAKHKLTQSEARKELAKMLFIRDDVFKKISSLSGGEKSRLRLASLIFDKVNLLILDEPTNHLDIDSREVLEDTLAEYDGTILFVSHDRYFVQRLATKMLIINNDNSILYPVPYEDYLEAKKKLEVKAQEKKEVKTPKKQHVRKEKKSNNTYKINKLEEKIAELEEKLDLLTKEMEDNSDNAEKLYEFYIDKENIENELLENYEELENLQ